VLGAAALLVTRRPVPIDADRGGRVRRLTPTGSRLVPVAAIGCAAGILTVLAGVGGPLVAVPALVLLGVDTAAAVGAALLGSVVGSGLGALALLPAAGDLMWPVLVTISCVQLAGVTAGVLLRSRIPTARLPQLIAVTAVAAAAWLFWQSR
jgi:uncharacterized membrane protein YfcA